MSSEKSKVIIIGGGAAGFFTAANLDGEKYEILILEKAASPMQKIKISGGGRCNVTHACFDPGELVEFYPRGYKELLSVFTKFQPGDTMAWFQERNLDLKIEKDGRIFPVTDSSESVITVLQNEAVKNGAKVRYKCGVIEIIRNNNQWLVKTKENSFLTDKVVFCTGSSPAAYKILKKLNIKIKKLVPSLFTFNIKNPIIRDLMGTSFENAIVRIPALKTEESGPLLITHWGLSGPAILKLSAWCARELQELNYKFEIEVNFLGIPVKVAEEIFQEYKTTESKKFLGHAKIFDVSKRFWLNLLKVRNINIKKQLAQVNNSDVQEIITSLCACKMVVNGKSTFKEEFVTAGGVELNQVDFRTMKIKDLDDFYIAGEVLDIDAITGGFNFQACWSEAWLISKALNDPK